MKKNESISEGNTPDQEMSLIRVLVHKQEFIDLLV